MKPLQWLGFGLLVVGAKALVGGYDLLFDPAGWVLALVGVRRLAGAVDLPHRGALLVIGVVALLCSGPLWWPGMADRLDDVDHAVLWSVGLAELVFQLVLCHDLAGLARRAADDTATLWFRICEGGLVLGILAPVLYFAAGQDWLLGVGALGELVQLAVFVLCFWYSGRAWAGAQPAPTDADADATGQ